MGARASPLALATSSVGLLRADARHVPALIQLCRLRKQRVHDNLLAFAVVYNGLAILLASLGVLSPVMAAIAHDVGCGAVVLSSARPI
jgi:cation transport ATPase